MQCATIETDLEQNVPTRRFFVLLSAFRLDKAAEDNGRNLLLQVLGEKMEIIQIKSAHSLVPNMTGTRLVEEHSYTLNCQ